MKSRIQKQSLIGGTLLIVLGTALFIETFTDLTSWGWALVLAAAGFFALVINWNERSNWVYHLPTYILWAIAGLLVLININVLMGEWIATYVLIVIGFPFVIGWWRNQSNWGLLIPAYVMLAVGIMVGLIGMGWLNDLLIPAYVMLAIAAPFFVVYFLNKSNWWALIPGGIMGFIGISFLLATPAVRFVVPIVLVLIGVFIIVRNVMRGSQEE